MSTQIEPISRHLPAALPREAERIGYKMLAALDRLGFVHTTEDGKTFTVRFSGAALFGDELASYTIDTERLYHFAIGDLTKPRVVEHLSNVVHKPVKASGGMYLVRLKSAQPARRLPTRADMDLDTKPAGDLMVPIGKTRNGDLWWSLPGLGHCLIVGTTGSGKSTFIHSALAALLTANAPDKLRVVLIDPKRSELTPWAHAPHLLGNARVRASTDVVHTEAQATRTLGDMVAEIDRRGDLMAGLGARDITSYDKRAADPLPLVLVVIDECLDLVLSAGDKSDLVGSLKTIASRGRSAGVYLWAATQHAAAVAGLPRVVNVNLTTRIVFRVADQSAALVAGCPGAQSISRDRPGRLLAKIDSTPFEVQGYYVSDDNLQAIARNLNTQTGPTLSESEQALVAYAMQQLDGCFIVNKLAQAFAGQWTNYKVTELAKTWERRGWLTRPAHATDSRKVTPKLAAMAGIKG